MQIDNMNVHLTGQNTLLNVYYIFQSLYFLPFPPSNSIVQVIIYYFVRTNFFSI